MVRTQGFWRIAILLGPALLASTIGCGQGDDRLTAYPVTGEVFVDGKPATDCFVYFNPVVPDSKHPMRPYGQVDSAGKFSISTYLSGDGAPPGEYIVTFEWLTYQPLGNQWGGPDKLGDKYSDPKKSEFRVKVEEKPMQLKRFELTTQ
jgi:hypothetical protein